MTLRALTESATVAVEAASNESEEFQIPYWATHVGVSIPETVGKGSIELHMAQSTGGTFQSVLNVGLLKMAKADGGYFEIGPYIIGAGTNWVFKFVFGKVQATAFDITINYRGA